MSKTIGMDVGYGFVKVTDGTEGYSFPSVVGEGHTKSTFSTRVSKSLLDDLKIDIGKGLNFVGKTAIKHSKYVFRDLSNTRNIGDDFEILVLSALGFFCDSQENTFSVVTGLPVDRMDLRDQLIKKMRGSRDVTLYKDGRPVNVNINIVNVEIVPQPLGAFWAHYPITSVYSDMRHEERTGVIDIGFKTSDLAAIEDSEYIPQKSKTIPVGLSTAYGDIGAALILDYGLQKESYALDSIVVKRSVNVAGEVMDISSIIDNALERLANNVLVEINSLWQLREFDSFIISGGGGQAISKYLLRNLTQAKLVADPITANCQGFLAWANRLWGDVKEETEMVR